MKISDFFYQFVLCGTKLLPSGMPCRIMMGPLKGKKWLVGSAAGEGKGMSVVINRAEFEMMNYAENLLKNNKDFRVCFDIGANAGLYTLLFSKYAEKVYAFEPLPRNIKYLTRILEINKVRRCSIVPAAVSSCSKISFFSEGANCALGKLDTNGTMPVLVITCDQFFSETGIIPDLLKIDVEGEELNLLEGAEKLLDQHHPSILLSTHSDQLRVDCFDFLTRKNYMTFIPLNSESLEKASEFAIHFQKTAE